VTAPHPRRVGDVPTPALLIDSDALDRKIATMAAARPGARMRDGRARLQAEDSRR
jgi:D-serine deaminase-like pyridoxal phosphate-dependent protein